MFRLGHIVSFAAVVMMLGLAAPGMALAQTPTSAQVVVQTWYKLILELVRHTPTYSPPVASRSFAYIGVTAYEAVASGSDDLRSLAGQLNGLQQVPARDPALAYDDGVVVQAAMAAAAQSFFGNTGPTGQRAMTAMQARLHDRTAGELPADVIARSVAHGQEIAAHVLAWSRDDGGAETINMGFPLQYTLTDGAANWVPTSLIAQQQMPLLPDWGENRPFAMPHGAACPLPPPPAYSEEPGTPFHDEAAEVYRVTTTLLPEQREIARFWSDDPMLSPTPPGHWISIAMEILADEGAAAERQVEVAARLGVALADAFIGCWHSKYEYDLLRPVTYIQRVIDPSWQPYLITPPFPEYPSGHSTLSGAAAAVLTDLFGADFAFTDTTHVDEGLGTRSYPDFWTAAEEAGISRLYGGIHFRAAIERGLDQGRCIATHANALRTRN